MATTTRIIERAMLTTDPGSIGTGRRNLDGSMRHTLAVQAGGATPDRAPSHECRPGPRIMSGI